MRFSAFQFPSVLVLLLLGIYSLENSCSSASAAEHSTLDGWGDYKFGMTLDQVRAIPDINWGQLITTKTVDGKQQRTIMSRSKGNANGFDFDAVLLDFDPQLKLTSIYVSDNNYSMPPANVAQCEQQFQNVLQSLERRYGTFTPEQVKDSDTRKMTFRDLPGAQSQYGYDIPNVDTEAGRALTNSSVGNTTLARAVYEVGNRQILVNMMHTRPNRETGNLCTVRFLVGSK